MNRTTQRTMEILKYIGDNPQGVYLHNIVTEMDIPKSSAYVILQTLIQMKYVVPQQGNTNRYTIGVECFALGMKYISEMNLTRETAIHFAPLAEKYGKTGFVGLLDGTDVVYLQKYKSSGAMLASCEIGSRKMAHTTALGKTILAHLQPEAMEDVLKKIDYIKTTEYTIDNENELRTQLETIRARGYAMDLKENNNMLVCCAAPVFDHTNQVIAAISLSDMYDESEDMQRLGEEMKQVAHDISHNLGYLR